MSLQISGIQFPEMIELMIKKALSFKTELDSDYITLKKFYETQPTMFKVKSDSKKQSLKLCIRHAENFVNVHLN